MATVLIIGAGVSIVGGQSAGQSVEQSSSPSITTTYGPSPGEVDSRRFTGVSSDPVPPMQPPLERSSRPVRAATIAVQRPAPTLAPVNIKIPALDIDQDPTELAVVGTDLQVPDDYEDVGWWRGGPAPGEAGASVMVGHVDSPTGPAVFYQLSGLRAGNRIEVALDDGSRTIFAVREMQVYERTRFPSARVYRSDGQPTLHLLTCGGSFDTEADQYSSNVVVYADLVKRIPPHGDKPGWDERLTQDSKRRLADKKSEHQQDKSAGESGWYERLTQDSKRRLADKKSEHQQDKSAGESGWYERLVRDSQRTLKAAIEVERG
ncbi:MAG: sortase [Actinomycetota bacterium]|nr:sortase [Actinomycetota bacterium]